MNSVYNKVFTNRPICNVLLKTSSTYLCSVVFLYIRVRMSCNIGDNRNLFLQLKSKLGLYHVVLTTPQTSPEKHTPTLVEMQQLPGNEKTESTENNSCPKWTIYNGRRKACVDFKTDIDKLNIIVYRYRRTLYLKDNGIDLK